MKIYTLGYVGWKMDEIKAEVERLGAVLIDVRLSPRSRFPGWNKSAFEAALKVPCPFTAALKVRYVHIPEFGNLNYKTGGPVRIFDYEIGQAVLASRFGQPYRTTPAIILMCSCKDVSTCHRKEVADRLARAWNLEVEHLQAPAREKPARRPKAKSAPSPSEPLLS
jgi:hypothetical protein